MIRALAHLRKQHPRSEHLRRCAAYYRKHKHRMDYAGLKAGGLPIGRGEDILAPIVVACLGTDLAV